MEDTVTENYDFTNVTTDPPVVSVSGASVFAGVLLAILSVVTVAGNIGTIWAFKSNVLLRQKPSNLLILSLSCCDLLVGASGLPVASIHTGLGYWPLGKPVCIITAFFSVIGVSAGMYTVTAISIDRWLLVSREYSTYLRVQSSRNVKVQIGAAWGAAILISTCETILWIAGVGEEESSIHYTTECRSPVRANTLFQLIIFALLFAIPFFVMVVSTFRFAFLLRRRLRRQKSRAQSASVRSPKDTANRVEELASTAGQGPDYDNKVCTSNGKEVSESGKSTSSPVAVSSDPSSNADSSGDAVAKPPRPVQKHPSLAQAGRNKSFFGLGTGASLGASRNKRTQKMKNRYIKPAVRLAILLGVFALCTLPYPFFLILADQSLVEARNHLSNLLLSNSGMNPFLYAIMHRKIRRFYVSKLTPCCKKSYIA